MGRCRLVNAQGPLRRLYDALAMNSEVNSPGQWLVRYWWVSAICGVVFIAISFCLLKYCSDLLPTSNPKLEGKMKASQALHGLRQRPTVRRRRE